MTGIGLLLMRLLNEYTSVYKPYVQEFEKLLELQR